MFKRSKFDKNKLKSRLKMAQTRINLLKNKTINSVKIQKRQTAALLREGKDESARIKAENIVREDYLLDALDILHLFCDLLLTRINLLAEAKECPHDMKEAISTLVYSAPRVDVEELMEIRSQIQAKFGKAFVEGAMENREMVVNQRVVLKLDLKVPKPHLCISYIKQIAEENGIEWEDVEDSDVQQDHVDNPELGYPSRNEATGYNVDFNPNIAIHPMNPHSPVIPSPTISPDVPPNSHIPNLNQHILPDPSLYAPMPPQYQPEKSASQKRQEIYAPTMFHDVYDINQDEYNLPPPIAPSNHTPNYSLMNDVEDEEDDLQRRLKELSKPRNRNDYNESNMDDTSENGSENGNNNGSDEDQHDFDELKKRFERLNRR